MAQAKHTAPHKLIFTAIGRSVRPLSADSCWDLRVCQATDLMICIRPWMHLLKHGLTVHAKVHFSRGTSQTVNRTNSCFSYASLIHFSISCSYKTVNPYSEYANSTEWRPHPRLRLHCNMSHLYNLMPKKERRGEKNWLQALVSRNTNPYLWQYFSTIMGSKLKNLVLGLLFCSRARCTAKCTVLFALMCKGLRW